MKKLFTKFGSHYAIERFGFVFLTLFLCMSLLLGVIFSQKVKSDHKILTGRAVYTSSFTMSLTGVAGFVEGVYTNEDHSKCFLLWHFDDMTQLPVSVDEYMFLLKGYDLSTGIHPFTKCNPATSFYVFGNTGYMGLYFYQQSGFESQVLELTVRSLNNFPGNSGRDEAQGMSGDTSRYSYDQGIIYFNPGGSYATRVSFLDKEDWSPFDVYNEIITVPQEVSIRNLLKTELSNMHRLRLMMNEYERRLTGYGVLPSEVPVEIATDNIYATLSSVSVLDQKPLEWSTKYSAWIDVDTNKYYLNRQVNLNYVTDYVPSGGFYFDWQDSSVKNGYLQTLTSSTDLRVWAEYVSGVRAEEQNDDFNRVLNAVRWYYSNGAEVDLNALSSESAIDTDKALYTNITSLMQCWSDYYDLKKKYHRVDLGSLLDLERDVRSVESNYNMRIDNGGDLITIYSEDMK